MWIWLLLAGLVGYGVWRFALGYPRTTRRMARLWPGEAAFVASAADAMFPAGGPIRASGAEADVPRYLDRLLDASHPRTRLLMHLLFFLVEHLTFWVPAPGHRGRRRFSSLDLDQRVAVLDGWQHSSLFVRRLVFTSLRSLVTLGYFAHPPLLRELRLAPFAIESPVCEADLLYPRIGARRDSIAFTRADLSQSDGVPVDLDGPLHPDYVESPL